jgi:hypothetical protein
VSSTSSDGSGSQSRVNLTVEQVTIVSPSSEWPVSAADIRFDGKWLPSLREQLLLSLQNSVKLTRSSCRRWAETFRQALHSIHQHVDDYITCARLHKAT